MATIIGLGNTLLDTFPNMLFYLFIFLSPVLEYKFP